MIIQLPNGSIQFKSILIKPHFIDDQEPVSDSFIPIQVSQAKEPPIKKVSAKIPLIKVSLADLYLIKPAAKSS